MRTSNKTNVLRSWYMMQPTKRFQDGSMLPLLGVLEHNKHIRSLKLAMTSMHDARFRLKFFIHLHSGSFLSFINRTSGNGNSNARVLNRILKANDVIEELDLSDTGLDDDGLG
jgi:hypothetical protein